MKYFSKCLLIYSLIFSMVNLSVTSTGITFMKSAYAQETETVGLPSISESQENFINATDRRSQAQQEAQEREEVQQAQAEAAVSAGLEREQAKQEAADAEGEERAQGSAKRLQTAEWLSLINMLAIAVIATSLWQYKWTMDIGLMIAGGVIFIAGEIYSIIKYKDFNAKQIEKVLSYEREADGTVNMDEAQLAMFEEQKKAYEAAKKTAQTKSMLQGAAAVAFAAGGLMALTQETTNQAQYSGCIASLTAAQAQALGACPAACTAESAASLGVSAAACITACEGCAAQIGVLAAELGEIQAFYNAPGMSIEKHPKLQALCAKFGGSQVMTCKIGTTPVMAVAAVIHGSTCGAAAVSPLTTFTGGNAIAVVENKTNRPALNDQSHIAKIAKFLAPDKMRKLVMDQDSFELEKDEVAEQLQDNGFKKFASIYDSMYDFSPERHGETEVDELRKYLKFHEGQRFADGEVKSISIDEYNNFEDAFSPDKNIGFEWETKEVLKVAMEEGLDLIFPKAEASLKGTLGVGAVAIGVLLGMSNASFKMIDLWLAVPGHRAMVFGGMAAIATASVVITRGIIGEMESNIKKLDEIMKQMRKVRGGQGGTQEIAGNNQTTVRASTSFQDLDQDVPVAEEGQVFECVTKNKQGKCVSVRAKIENSEGFSNLGGSFGQVASLTGSVADGIAGQSNLSSGTLNSANRLAGLQNAVARRLKKEQVRYNTLRKQSGKKPVNFDRGIAKMKRRIENAIKKSLQNQNVSPESFLANTAIIPPSSVKDGKKKEKATGKNSLKGIAKLNAFPVLPSTNFKIDPLEDEFLDEPTDDLMASNADAVANLDSNEEASDDINEDPNASIWNVISVRYMKTGLSRLLGRNNATAIENK